MKNFMNKKNKRENSEIEMEEVFLDNLLKKREEALEISDKKLEIPLARKIFSFFLFFSFILIVILWFFSFKYQIIEGKEYLKLAEKNKFVILKLSTNRGVIYDRNFKQLVKNEMSFDLVFEPDKLPKEKSKRDEIVKQISSLLGRDFINDKEEVIKNVSSEFVIFFESNKEQFPGFSIQQRNTREYEKIQSLAHLLGYLGKEGVEKIYDDVLKENKGEIEIEKDVYGKEIKRNIVEYPQSGKSIVLSIDTDLQKKAEESLERILERLGSRSGAIVAMNPQTGEILASVSLPSYDNNLFAKGISEDELNKLNSNLLSPQLNRVIAGAYQIGSSIKPFIGYAALEEKIIIEKTTLYCPLELCLKNIYSGEKECFSDWTFHGFTDIKRAIAESINPFFYMIGGGYTASEFSEPALPRKFKGLGIEKIKEYLNLFGFGEKTNIDLPGEIEGRIPDAVWKENYFKNRSKAERIWYLGDTYNLSIGQGYLLISPLQLVSAYAAIANNGTLYQPKIINKIIDEQKNLIKEIPPEIRTCLRQNLDSSLCSEIKKTNFINSENLQIIKEGMRQAVTSPSGSSYLLNSLPVSAAAKTGTAQTQVSNIYNNWVTVFAPYENPQIVLTVLVEDVSGIQAAALPVAKEILEWYFTK
ncbi:hypothetical protein COS93_00465 [bacterium (Candidatus Gribaldobacteria) CG07_land_8_20_14_0_80_33_18]|uniref:Penicillin-binding protein 2 n=1 Tax=bacterium (Candidatus Gribaldobacteria) CG07_land_8_20_14_0_80_33_18 TaxID=2014272 RepID=A0A2M6Z491_9BACT|nr:MAG: hypothetical protein COU04_01570 [bacterium (Candidatus Gribaldobacteria) CG10_big_fil_rev_8_21_14_0_10_33_41]PIU47206.1 MAG: hypothetical protein COS93_00465 [bacterium (Candidatus Gribaldobacteria) CG07_land_8_20_14_0_80_33_18]PJA00966.1 MAG: hypothetical protein COX75_01240 [bacterium (Candidatus Gribaldobacteria) CG_4_10_14_0_2_um_filter_33_15]PJB08584.1 MAG: hypothetical protein CO122_01475 [bacterium (Candidatus Gribaldobacteria) CG_4_9_14_3_um_filter_33_9]